MPFCILLPLKGKKITILHSPTILKDYLHSLTGFHATAPAKSIKIEDVGKPVIRNGWADVILNTKLPSLAQFLATCNSDSITTINGDS